MKHLLPLLFVALVLPCCTTATTYHADGSKTVVKSVDPNAWFIGNKALDTVVVTASSK